MARLVHRDRAQRVLLGPVDCHLHRSPGDNDTEALLSVDNGGCGRVAYELQIADRHDTAVPQAANVAGRVHHPVRIVAKQVRVDEVVRDDGGLVWRDAHCFKDISPKRAKAEMCDCLLYTSDAADE